MNKLFLIVLTIASFLFFSCNDDVDINADFQDITVVHSAINPNDNVHYVKINRAFLQDGVNANELAANSDNFNYPAGELTVTVDEVRVDNENLVATFPLTRTVNEIIKNPGIFANDSNVLFKFTATINRNNRYKLKIVNNKLNKEITSETLIVDNIVVDNPATFAFWQGNANSGNLVGTDKPISITTGDNIGRVEAFLVFNYTNFFLDNSSATEKVVMNLGEKKTLTNKAGEKLEWSIASATFFDNVIAAIPASLPNLSHRKPNLISLEFKIIGTELNIFMEVNEPSNSVNQEKPDFTNITNGLGIFSSQSSAIWNLATVPPSGTNLSTNTINRLNVLGLSFCGADVVCPF